MQACPVCDPAAGAALAATGATGATGAPQQTAGEALSGVDPGAIGLRHHLRVDDHRSAAPGDQILCVQVFGAEQLGQGDERSGATEPALGRRFVGQLLGLDPLHPAMGCEVEGGCRRRQLFETPRREPREEALPGDLDRQRARFDDQVGSIGEADAEDPAAAVVPVRPRLRHRDDRPRIAPRGKAVREGVAVAHDALRELDERSDPGVDEPGDLAQRDRELDRELEQARGELRIDIAAVRSGSFVVLRESAESQVTPVRGARTGGRDLRGEPFGERGEIAPRNRGGVDLCRHLGERRLDERGPQLGEGNRGELEPGSRDVPSARFGAAVFAERETSRCDGEPVGQGLPGEAGDAPGGAQRPRRQREVEPVPREPALERREIATREGTRPTGEKIGLGLEPGSRLGVRSVETLGQRQGALGDLRETSGGGVETGRREGGRCRQGDVGWRVERRVVGRSCSKSKEAPGTPSEPNGVPGRRND